MKLKNVKMNKFFSVNHQLDKMKKNNVSICLSTAKEHISDCLK